MARTKGGKEAAKEPEFEIETFLQKRGEGRTLQYMVKWRGYPDSDNTWESVKDLPKPMVKKFEAAAKLKDAEDAASSDEEDYSPKKTPKKSPKKKPAKKTSSPRKRASPEPAKKTRGRPKKPVVEADSESEEEEEEVVPVKKSRKTPTKTAKKPAKKSPAKKAATKKVPEVVVITAREIRDNIVHYKKKGDRHLTPVYEFNDFQPIFDFELEQAQKDESALTPIRVIERKGAKYHVEFTDTKGKQSKSWVTKTTLSCVKIIDEFDDRDEDSDEENIEYTVKKIIGKRKNGRIYEYQVVWSGYDEDTATWEPAENLSNARTKIVAFEDAEAKAWAKHKNKKKASYNKKRISK